MGQLGKTIAAAGQFSVMYGEGLLKDIKQETAARHPEIGGTVVKCNHPVWVYGHLANYSSSMCEAMGLPPGPTARPDGWNELFKNGTECKDDPTGTIYPKLSAVTKHYLDGYKYILSKLPEVSDEALSKPNPAGGRMTELMPTVGMMVTFLMTGHPMSHLGQVSTWRRCMGLGSAM